MPEIENRVTLGNVITIAVLFVSGVIAFSTVQAQTAVHSQELEDHEQRLRVVENAIAGSLGRIDQRLSAIEKAIEQ